MMRGGDGSDRNCFLPNCSQIELQVQHLCLCDKEEEFLNMSMSRAKSVPHSIPRAQKLTAEDDDVHSLRSMILARRYQNSELKIEIADQIVTAQAQRVLDALDNANLPCKAVNQYKKVEFFVLIKNEFANSLLNLAESYCREWLQSLGSTSARRMVTKV